MDADVVADFFAATLLLGAAGLIVAALNRSIRTTTASSIIGLSALVAVGATGGSLYFSEVAGFEPCELCWFQRIAMYPLAVLLTIAAWRRDHGILPYAMTLSVLGLGVSAYHIQLQWFPEQSSVCQLDNPCSGRWVEALGWMTIPQMAGLAFAIITALGALSATTKPVEQR